MDPSTQFGVIAAREAWSDSGDSRNRPRPLAVAFATGIGGVWTLLDAWDTLRDKGPPRRVLPMTVPPMLMPNGVAAAVSLDLAPGPARTLRSRPALPAPRPSTLAWT